MNNYYELEVLKEVYLEDSFVLSIHETVNQVEFKVDAVLTERHPKYTKPKANEQYCYKRTLIIFANCEMVQWSKSNNPPACNAAVWSHSGWLD